tara:strand:+ start:109 stop:333 length:225 start_codon:yes stop_codon:yes gene_type:complete
MSWTFLLQRLHYMSNLEVNMKVGDMVEFLGYPYIGVVKKAYINNEGNEMLLVITADGMQWNRNKGEFYLLEDQW